MEQWGALDLAALIDWMSASHHASVVNRVAHSTGGQVFGLAANNGRVGALRAVAAQSGL